MHKHATFLRENISKKFLWLNVRDQKYILKTEHGEENKMYLFLFKTIIFLARMGIIVINEPSQKQKSYPNMRLINS